MHKTERVKLISDLLNQTSSAHHTLEQEVLNGEPDEQWFDWYTDYLIGHGLDNLLGNELASELLSRFLLESAEESKQEETKLTWAEFTARKIVKDMI
jgi:hypothetical protein